MALLPFSEAARSGAAAHIQFQGAECRNDGLGMMAVLKERISDRFGPVEEEAAEQSVLFLRDQLPWLFLPMKTNDELHDGGSVCFMIECLE